MHNIPYHIAYHIADHILDHVAYYIAYYAANAIAYHITHHIAEQFSSLVTWKQVVMVTSCVPKQEGITLYNKLKKIEKTTLLECTGRIICPKCEICVFS